MRLDEDDKSENKEKKRDWSSNTLITIFQSSTLATMSQGILSPMLL